MSQRKRKYARGSINFITSCISTTMVLLLLGTVVFFVSTAKQLGNSLRENFTLSLMLDDQISAKETQQLAKNIKKHSYVLDLTYISKEQATKEQAKILGTDPKEFLGESPIPASFELRLKADYANQDSLTYILPKLKSQKHILEIAYPKELMKSVNRNIQRISLVMLIIAILLTFVSFSLINNTIRLSIYSQRFIIRTMQLVGANKSFIRRPFINKSLWIGILSSFFADVIILVGIKTLIDWEPRIVELITWKVCAFTTGSVLVAGILLTFFCAYFSVNTHLRMRTEHLYIK